MNTPLDFSRADLADGVDAPPLVFKRIRVPCACGRSLDEAVYTFFPTAVYICGICPVCGPQSALFAPEMERQTAGELVQGFLQFLAAGT